MAVTVETLADAKPHVGGIFTGPRLDLVAIDPMADYEMELVVGRVGSGGRARCYLQSSPASPPGCETWTDIPGTLTAWSSAPTVILTSFVPPDTLLQVVMEVEGVYATVVGVFLLIIT